MTHPNDDSSPVHWTYDTFTADADLQQGDIIESTDTIRVLCEPVHPYFCDQKFLGFMVITQSCDLVRRKKKECSAHYINLAVIRSLEEVLPNLFDSVCKPLAPNVYANESKSEAQKLLSRIFNQNEQALGVFYLHPDAQAGVAVPSLVLLRVSVSFRAEHYQTLVNSRRGRLKPEFQSKLGWLTGNLFSRVGTTDWHESPSREKELEKLIAVFIGNDDKQQPEKSPLWINKYRVDAARKAGEITDQTKRDEILSIIEKYPIANPKQDIAKAVNNIIRKVIKDIDDETIKKIENRLLNDAQINATLKRARLDLG